MLVTLNNSIDTNIQSDDLLKRFEKQFDLVHNNFIAKLSRKTSKLIVNERKMCAREENLSSKEIAPLIKSFVRGVEGSSHIVLKSGLGRGKIWSI